MSPRIVVRVITTSAFLLLSETGFAQTTGTPPTRPPAGNPTTGTGSINTTNLPNTNNTTNTNNTSKGPGYTPPIFLSGRVALEDGSPPPEPATIERVCGSSARAEGYTDSHGNFGIQLGNESGVFQDASETPSRNSIPGSAGSAGASTSTGTGGMGSGGSLGGTYNRYQNCDLRAKLAGYRSQSISLANRQPLDDPNIGTILLHKDGGEGGTLVSASTLGAPKEARKAYERGLQFIKKSKSEDAAKEFEKAVQIYPQHAEAWFELGRIQIERGQTEVARQSFSQSIQSDPKYVLPHVQLSLLALQAKQWKELAYLSDRGMRLDSFDYPQLFLFNAVANYNLHHFDVAERSLKQAIRLDTQHRFPDIIRLNGLILVLHKDYQAAVDQFQQYLKASPDAEEAAAVRKQLAEIEQAMASATSRPKE